MKESIEAIRELALAVANDRDPKGLIVGTISSVANEKVGSTGFSFILENHLTDHERYYFELMEERGLIRFVENGSRVHLTAGGQDFCHAVSDQEVWDRMKPDYLDAPFDLGRILASFHHEKVFIMAVKGTVEKDIF